MRPRRKDAALAALRELAGGRADLLAEVAGILEGASGEAAPEPECTLATPGSRLF